MKVESEHSKANSEQSKAGNEQAKAGSEHDRNREITNLVELIGFAAMGIRAHDLSIAAVNQTLEARLGLPAATLTAMGP